MKYQLFLDTNALLNLQANAFKEKFIIAQKTLEEIESIKTSGAKDGEIKYKSRNMSRLLNEHDGDYEVIAYSKEIESVIAKHYLEATPDNIILATAKWYDTNVSPVLVCTDDLNCRFISRNIFNLETKGINDINLVKNLDEYTGWKDIILSDEEMSSFYTHLNKNQFDCLVNEYLIVRKSDGEIVDYRRWNGIEYAALSYKQINSHFLGKIKPRNPQQVLAFDMIQNKDKTIKVLSGKWGSGKSFICVSHAIKLIEEGKFDKLIFVRNPVGLKDVQDIGYLPGTMEEKTAGFNAVLSDHLGGESGLEIQIMQNNIEITYLAQMRGRSLSNAIIYCTEAENLTKEHVQLLISRVGEGCELWLDGDVKQVDSPIYRQNNGLLASVQKLAGHEKFGYVQLTKTERSETAAMADLLD